MADSLTILEEAGGVAVLTLNRPEKRNALSRALRDEIMLRLDALEQSDAVRVVVLTGAAPAFCAGFDRTEFSGDGMEKVFAQAIEYHRRVYITEGPFSHSPGYITLHHAHNRQQYLLGIDVAKL